MRDERLLERIRSFERDPARRGRPDHGRLVESVLAHLRQILNTRQGSAPIAPDYGVPDFLDFLQTYPDSVREIERSIRVAIQTYEPRLDGVRVAFIPQEDDVLALRFQITARITDDDGGTVRFETVVDTDGKIAVKR
ncbi:type VI secretion system lysozyme-related protein [Geobacter metallireducens RCH3]|uniref:Type VI secretion system needle hub protein TssE n=1 Tax=Geobacter metallireducens (strain ATCC 53774 / DSM 7210 / GS-15) TaxID=269799 RepID=Q39QE9_GEOMG|nr:MULTISPECIES: type VI secretion system baseplate subunit TssE [Geobacter]ABB33525.1 type VI secretion system needle hub protein TssE [Geobacter metallireducens GS-15]EHP87632.1 type VI secretion system lysozyme-related protein [Geobacter metallireducens RCH3]MBT1074165.1 type VI secretion system baseplate subunit TssE [Geobacter grbiciae]